MTRNRVASRVAAALIAVCLAPQIASGDRPVRPNIVLIMADDMGVECLGSYGGRSYRTPHLDRLAKEGLRFEHAYAQPLCTNTRLQLMTGVYNDRNWIAFGILDPQAKTIGHWMSELGYRTCIAGKWQLQSYDPPDYPGAAGRRGIGMRVGDAGFDRYSLWHTGHTELKGSRYASPKIFEDGAMREGLEDAYGPDVWVDYIREFMEQNREQPFFVYYSMALPHWPMTPTPDSPQWKRREARDQEDVANFGDMVAYCDKCVGRIVDGVDRLGLSENTLILFYSDNGTHLKVTSQTREGPVAGGKGETTDNGTHVPLIVRWKGRVAPGVSQALVDSTDFIPTLAEASGVQLNAKLRSQRAKLDGESFYPALLGETAPRRWVFCHFDPRPGWDKDRFHLTRFVRDRRFKLYDDGRLFDVESDAQERRPLTPRPGSPSALASVGLRRVFEQRDAKQLGPGPRRAP